MNDGIVLTALKYLGAVFSESYLGRGLSRIYAFFSKGWRQSFLVGIYRKSRPSALESSVSYRLLRAPLSIANRLGEKAANVSEKIKESLLYQLINAYFEGFAGLNTRFLGAMGTSGVFAYMLFAVLIKGNLPNGIILLPLAFVLGLSTMDVNLTDLVAESGVFGLFAALSGINPKLKGIGAPKMGGAHIAAGALGGLLAGALGILLGRLYAPLAAVGIFILILILKYPVAGVYLAFFAAPLAPTMAMVGLCLFTMLALFLRAAAGKVSLGRFGKTAFFLIATLLVFGFSSAASFAPKKSILVWAVYAVFMGFFLVIINTVKSREHVLNLMRTFAISAFWVAAYGIFQYVFGIDTQNAWLDEEMFEEISMRVYSTLENPNVLGEYLLLSIPVAVALVFIRDKWLPRLAYAAAGAAMLLCLVLTQSRGCWLGIMLSAAFFVSFVCGRLWALILVIAPFGVLLLPKSIIERFTSIGDMKDSSTSYRVYIWLGTIAMLRDFWLWGIGMGEGAFGSVYPFYAYSTVIAPHSHNLYLQILTESGAVGLILFLLLLYSAFKEMYIGSAACGKGSAEYTAGVAIAAGLLGFLLQGVFDYVFYNYRVMLMFWMVLALGVSIKYISRGDAA